MSAVTEKETYYNFASYADAPDWNISKPSLYLSVIRFAFKRLCIDGGPPMQWRFWL